MLSRCIERFCPGKVVIGKGIAVEVLNIGAIVDILASLPPVTDTPKTLFVITPSEGEETALCISGMFGSNINNPIYRIGTP